MIHRTVRRNIRSVHVLVYVTCRYDSCSSMQKRNEIKRSVCSIHLCTARLNDLPTDLVGSGFDYLCLKTIQIFKSEALPL